VGVTGDVIQAEIADVTFPVLTATNELYVIDTTKFQPGSTLLVEKTKDNIISLAVLLTDKDQAVRSLVERRLPLHTRRLATHTVNAL
jgi:hypothetical protein